MVFDSVYSITVIKTEAIRFTSASVLPGTYRLGKARCSDGHKGIIKKVNIQNSKPQYRRLTTIMLLFL